MIYVVVRLTAFEYEIISEKKGEESQDHEGNTIGEYSTFSEAKKEVIKNLKADMNVIKYEINRIKKLRKKDL